MHFPIADLRAVPRRGFDLYLYLDDEPRQMWPHDLRPAAWWLMDGRPSLEKCESAAISFEHVFAARRSTVRLLGERSVHAHWLPPACGPIVSNAVETRRHTDVCLIGRETGEAFKATAELLRKRFSGRQFSVSSQNAAQPNHFDCRLAACLDTSGWGGFEPIEAIGTGAALLIEQSEAADLLGLMRDGVHYVSYCGPHELLAQMTFYLKRQDLWHRMSRAGRLHATTHGDYFARMQQLLAECTKSSRAFLPRAERHMGVGSAAPLTELPVDPVNSIDQLLELIPKTASRVLDLDGSDELAERLNARQHITVEGIISQERDGADLPNAIAKLHIGHAPALCGDLPAQSFDCILLQDWLERVENPAQLLRDVRRLLAPGGCAIAQISNMGYGHRVASLLNGNWTYGAGGAMPADAINMFNRRSAERWFAAGGWDIRQVVALSGPNNGGAPSRQHMAALSDSGVFDAGVPCDPQAQSYLLRAEPIPIPVELPTIVVVSQNRAPDLRAFTRSLFRSTEENTFELLFIDTGWDEEERAFLRSIESTVPLRVVELSVGASFIEAITEGMRRSRGASAVLVSPTMRFTPGWLDRLLAKLGSDPQVALVGPRIAMDTDEVSIEVRADFAAAELVGTSTVAEELSCACLLVRRDQTPEIEWIHPRTDDGTLAVARLSKAAIKRGQQALIAPDACVWSTLAPANAAEEWSRLLAATGQAFPMDPEATNKDLTLLPCGRRILDLRMPPLSRNVQSFLSRELDETQTSDPAASFDCILAGEVLSYVPDALQALASLRACLTPGGVVKARFANACHRDSIGDVIEGRPLPIRGAGGLPPLRHLTRREIEKLFYRAGFTHRSITPEMESDASSDSSSGGGKDEIGQIRCGPLRVSGLGEDDAERFRALSYVVEASPAPRRIYAKTSILVIAGPQTSITRRCIESVRLRTDEPYELIVMTGSDANASVLRSLCALSVVSPLAGGPKQTTYERAIEQCTGRHIVLLNDRITVTTGWLRRMLRALHLDKSIAVVGPCCNAGSGAQGGPPVHDSSLLDGLAWEWGKAHDGMIEDAAALMPSCLLLSIRMLKQLGTPEPIRVLAQLAKTGRRAVVARDSYVHSSGEPEAIIDRPTKSAPLASTWRAEPDGSDLVLVRDRPPISLCMIVRDSARTLGRCLRSIRPWVSEMIVVDTGSVDGTPELARRLGARVFHFPWCCDFAAARNESIRHACGQWIFWMDADDTMNGVNGRRLMELAAEPARPNLLGYVMQVHCPGGGHRGDVTVVDHVKLFQNRPDLRFQGRIHEQILPAIRRAGGEVGWTDVYVTHSGADYSAAGRRRKFARDVRLLHLELRDRPNHSFTLFNLGMTHADVGEHSTAADYLRQSLDRSEAGESHVRKIYALLAASLSHLQRNTEAYETCLAGLKSFPLDAELNFRAAISAHRLGNLAEAERLYMQVIAGGDARHFSSVDRGIAGFKAHYNLAGVYRDMGRINEANAQYRKVTDTAPFWADGWRALVNLQIECGQYAEAEQNLRRMSAVPTLAAEAGQLERRLEKSRRAEAAVAEV